MDLPSISENQVNIVTKMQKKNQKNKQMSQLKN